MSRKHNTVLTMTQYAELLSGRDYYVLVLHLTVCARTRSIKVELEHLDRAQSGRKQVVQLPAELLPNNITARFLRAAGCDLAIGQAVDVTKAVGVTVRVRFAPSSSDGQLQPLAFAPVKQETSHVEQPEQSDAQPRRAASPDADAQADRDARRGLGAIGRRHYRMAGCPWGSPCRSIPRAPGGHVRDRSGSPGSGDLR